MNALTPREIKESVEKSGSNEMMSAILLYLHMHGDHQYRKLCEKLGVNPDFDEPTLSETLKKNEEALEMLASAIRAQGQAL